MRALRRLALLGGALGAGALLAPAGAVGSGATYDVVQCHSVSRAAADARFEESRPYSASRACFDVDAPSLRINNVLRAKKGRRAAIHWTAPKGTGFVRVRVMAKLRRNGGHQPRLMMAVNGRGTHRFASGTPDAAPYRLKTWSGQRQPSFMAMMRCVRHGGCRESTAAKTWVRQLKFTVADYSDPEVSTGGSLLGEGWKRGEQSLRFSGNDVGSGLSRIAIRVNGAELTSAAGVCDGLIGGSELVNRLRPCGAAIEVTTTSSETMSPPFHDGQNAMSVCSYDFAGNETCNTQQVRVDNTAPALAFTSAQNPDDPELVRATISDAHSGVASGQISYRAEGEESWKPLETVVTGSELRARVDSTAVAPGMYEFRATAADVAGNAVETTKRPNGLAMRLAFPLKSGVKLNAHLEPGGGKRMTIRYGKRSRVAGVLRAASGEPLAGEEVVVEEYFGEGALIRERITRVRTDGRGRWGTRLPAGPSRRVTADYAGTQRYLSASTVGGRLAVRTRASLRTSRKRVPEGKRVVFRGRLGRRGARIPTGGKLLELQVKQDKRTYQTVGQSFRSKSNGRYRIGYRFGRFYAYNVRFRFRIKVSREADWPYKAPVRSRARTVKVLDR